MNPIRIFIFDDARVRSEYYATVAWLCDMRPEEELVSVSLERVRGLILNKVLEQLRAEMAEAQIDMDNETIAILGGQIFRIVNQIYFYYAVIRGPGGYTLDEAEANMARFIGSATQDYFTDIHMGYLESQAIIQDHPNIPDHFRFAGDFRAARAHFYI